MVPARLLTAMLCVLLWFCVAGVRADTFAVLVAGSNYYYNYRHQTDICHSYQILHENGVPDDNIVVMIYDDIASDPSNPFPGQLFNRPTALGMAGRDVYAGCLKDYTGSDVTAANFLNVITGNATAMEGIGSGKVLLSGPNDNVFLYFSDHGGTGLVAFPNGPFLEATDLNRALRQMHETEMYAKLTFYLEACESGSMFDGLLPDDINIYATTAANPTESSWGTYCPPADMINGVEIGACLGDEYSVNWMEDADRPDSMNESLETQFLTVQKETVESHVMQYGDSDWVQLPVGEFEGNLTQIHRRNAGGGVATAPARKKRASLWHRTATAPKLSAIPNAKVDSRHAKLQFLYWKYLRAHSPSDTALYGQQLQQEIQHRARVDALWLAFARHFSPADPHKLLPVSTSGHPKYCGKCCHQLLETVRTECPALASDRGEMNGWSDYSLRYARTIVNSCDRHESEGIRTHSVQEMNSVLRKLCVAPPV